MRPIFHPLLALGLAALGGCADVESTSEDFTETRNHYACALDGQRPVTDWEGNWGEIGEWCYPAALEEEGLADDVTATIESRYPGLVIGQRIGPWSSRKPIIAKLVKTITVSSHIAADRRGLREDWSDDEARGFVLGALSTIYQQSYFGQYKRVDGQLMLMRGGNGHQHGLMQIDDQWHHETVYGEQAGWDLLTNLDYGLGLLLDAYADAEGVSCVSDQKSLARAAYSIFNSGHANQACRWATSPTSADRYFVKRWDEITAPGKLDAYDWVIDYDGARAGVEDIDFVGILELGGMPGDEGGGPGPRPGACYEEDDDAPDVEAEALDLGDDFTDCDDEGPAEVITGKLTSNQDIDWFVYTADDTTGCKTNPTIITDPEPGVMVCQYLECVHDNAGSTVPEFECPYGSVPDETSDGRQGCCSNSGGFSIDSVNCVSTWHENLSVYVRIQSTAYSIDDFCADYSFEVHQ